MTIPTKITDHGTRAADNELGQFDDSPRMQAAAKIQGDEIQQAEDILYEIMTEITLATAVGVQLDMYGAIVGWPRLGLDDDDYRSLITVAIRINQGDGDVATVLYVIAGLLLNNGNTTVQYRQRGQAHYSVYFTIDGTELTADWIDVINDVMPRISPVGVSWEVIEGDEGSGTTFLLDTGELDTDLMGRRIDVL
jgi:hypothetical protein